MLLFFKPELLLPKVGSNLKIFFAKLRCQKNTCGYNITFHVKSLNQRGPIPIGTMLIQRFDLNRNIVAVSFFFDTA